MVPRPAPDVRPGFVIGAGSRRPLTAETRLSEPAYSKASFYGNTPQSRQYRGLDFDAYQKDPSCIWLQPSSLAFSLEEVARCQHLQFVE
jgi:hypothetical protein